MAVRDIKTTITLDGEKAFEAELRAISKEMRVTNSELKVLRTGFDNTDDKMGNLTRQSQLVKEKLEQQKNVVAALEREVKDAANAHGDASTEVQGLTLKLNSAKVAMNGLVKESQQVDREIEELGRDSDRAGRQIKNGIGDAADDASRDLRSMYDSFSGKLGDIKSALGLDIAMDFAGNIVDLVQGVNSFAEESREFNRQMSYLETNANRAGYDLEFVKDKFIEVSSVTGDTGSTIEGLSNLLQIGFDESELEKAIKGLEGAVVTFPDTMKFEQLSEDLRKTLAEGQATGQFAELLVGLKVNVDEFNQALEKSTTVEGDQQVVLSYLTGTLTDAANEYERNNQALIDAEASSLRLDSALAGLGSTFDTWLTPGRNALAGVIEELNEVLNSTDYTLLEKIMYALMLPSQSSPGDLEDAAKYNEGTIAAQKAAGVELPVVYYDDQNFSAEITDVIESQSDDLETAGKTAGMSVGSGLADGIAAESNLIVAEVSATVDQINEELSRVNPINLSVNTDLPATTTSQGGDINVSLTMDGRTVGKVVAPYVMTAAGGSLRQAMTK